METKILGNVTFSPPLKIEDSYKEELKEIQEVLIVVKQSIENIENKLDECLNLTKQNYRGNSQSITQTKEPQIYLFNRHLKNDGAKATVWWGTAVSGKNSSKFTYNSGTILTNELFYQLYTNVISLYNVLQSWTILHSPQTCNINIFTDSPLLYSLIEDYKLNNEVASVLHNRHLTDKVLKELFFYYKEINCILQETQTLPEKLQLSLDLAMAVHCK